MMGDVSSETCWAINKQWKNKLYYTVASYWFFLWDYITMHVSMNIKFINDSLSEILFTYLSCWLVIWNILAVELYLVLIFLFTSAIKFISYRSSEYNSCVKNYFRPATVCIIPLILGKHCLFSYDGSRKEQF
jgi:hypothetical protein